MFITNGKKITTRDQNDLGTLRMKVEELFINFGEISKKSVPPVDQMLEEAEKYVYYNVPDGMSLEFLLANGVELAAIDNDDKIQLRGKTSYQYKHQFNEEEKTVNSDSMAQAFSRKREIEAEAKSVAAQFKAMVAEQEAIEEKYAGFVLNGYEIRNKDCYLVLDFAIGKRKYVDAQTGLELGEEEMRPEDRQTKIAF